MLARSLPDTLATLLPAGAPIVLAVDDTLWHRVGRKIHGTAWHHDGNGPARHRPAWGHRWVVVGDAAYIGKPLQGLPAQVTVTARLRCDAALYQPAPPPTGRPGRPRLKGD